MLQENQRRQQAKQASEDRFRALASATADLFWITDTDRKMQEDNPCWRAFTGQGETDCKDWGWLECIYPADLDHFEAAWKEAVTRGQDYEIECCIQRVDGFYRTILVHGVPVRRDDDSIYEWMFVGTDITERKQVEEVSRRNEQQLHLITDAMPILIAYVDPQYRYKFVNKTHEQWYGHTKEAVLGKHIAEVLGETFFEERQPYLDIALSGQEIKFEARSLEKGGQRGFSSVHYLPDIDEHGKVKGCIVLSTNITEQKRREEALRKSEEQYRTIVQTANEGIWLIDTEARTSFVNDRMASLLGYTVAEMTGQTVFEFVFPEDLETAKKRIESSMQGDFEQFDCRFRRRDGGELYALACTSPVQDGQGNIIGSLGMFTDMTERWQAKKERALLLAREQAVLDVLPVGVAIMDANGRLLKRNAVFEQIWGQNAPMPEKIEQYHLYKAWSAATGKPLASEDRALARALMRGEVSINQETDIESFDGQRKTILHGAVPMYDKAGAIIGAATASLDITERKRLEHRTHQTLEALLAMTEVLVSHDAELDSERAVLTTAEIAQQLAELIRAILGCRGAMISDVDPETDMRHLVTSVGFSLEEERRIQARLHQTTLSESIENPELISRLHNGEVIVLDLTQTPFSTRTPPPNKQIVLGVPLCIDAKLVGLISLCHADPTHRFTSDEITLAGAMGKLAVLVIERERLLREREEARSSEMAMRVAKQHMDEFLSVASHELRTPLTTIKGNIQIARLRIKSALEDIPIEDDTLRNKLGEIKLMLERAERQTNVENRLVGDLLDVTRIQRNKLVIYKEQCDLAHIVHQVVEEHLSLAPLRHIRVDLPASESIPIFADDERIGQVVSNFLSNALKYSPPTSPIEIRTQVKGRNVRVSVLDKGPGIPLEEQERIWERFYRVPGIERRSGSSVGLGLGLYICRIIIEQHNGEIGVESTLGIGSTFWFTLPLSE